jgi:uncharacterized membrane protein HdeD (DUF308 family)
MYMAMTLNGALIFLMTNGIAMLGIGLVLLFIRATMTNLIFDAFGAIFALMLVAASLLFSALLDFVCLAGMRFHHLKELRRYLLLGMISAGAGLFFIFYPSASMQILCYFIAAYALFLGIGKLRLAQHWDCGSRERLVINVLGCMAVCFSGVLVAVASGDERNAIEVLGLYSLFVGAQMLLSTFYLYQQRVSRTKSTMEQKQAHA